jgi:hypothetical protein
VNFLRLLPVVVSFVLMAAHFLRADNGPLVAVSLVLPLMLLLPRPWVARVVQFLLVLAGIEWLRTMVVLISRRQDSGEPWMRLALILISVSLLTMGSALVFRLAALRERYSLGPVVQQQRGP